MSAGRRIATPERRIDVDREGTRGGGDQGDRANPVVEGAACALRAGLDASPYRRRLDDGGFNSVGALRKNDHAVTTGLPKFGEA
jgi:hypothetical protein